MTMINGFGDGISTPVDLVGELRIEAAIVPLRRGELYSIAADKIELLLAELRRVQDISLRECGIGFVDMQILHPEHERDAQEKITNESKLRAAAQRMVDAFAPHADKCRPCAIEWQNLKAALQNEA